MADPTPPRDGAAGIADRLMAGETKRRDLERPTGTQRAQAVANLEATIEALPVQFMQVQRASNFGLSSGWVTYVSATVTVPESKDQAQVMVVGTAAVLDETSGGVTVAYGRVQIDGNTGAEFPASKDAGASFVNNIITATHARSWAVTPAGSFTVTMQLSPLNPSAFPGDVNNFAQIAVFASFTGGA